MAARLAELGEAAAAGCGAEALREQVIAALVAVFDSDSIVAQVEPLSSAHGGSYPPPSEGQPGPFIDVSNHFRLHLDPKAEFTPERERWTSVIRSYMALWTGLRRVEAYNRFAVNVVDDLRQIASGEKVVPSLRRGAQLACGVLGVDWAILVALDGDERAAAFGASMRQAADDVRAADAVLPGERGSDAMLRRVNQWLESADLKALDAVPLPAGGMPVLASRELRGYPVAVGGPLDRKLVGLLVACVDPSRTLKIDRLLIPFARLASWALRDALRGEGMRRLEELQRLTMSPQASHPPDVVRRLKDIFEADVASLFLDDHGLLRLAATTDPDLMARGSEAVYEKGQGLTGWIFEHREPLRFFDAHDAAEFRRARGLASRPLHGELVIAGEPAARLLAVPMRHGDTTAGVLRMSRAHHRPHFTKGEQDALSFFADVLGAVLEERWEHQMARHVQELSADAVFVARASHSAGDVGSPIVDEHEGAARFYGRTTLIGVDAASLFPREAFDLAVTRAGEGSSPPEPIETTADLPDRPSVPIELSVRVLENKYFRPATQYWLFVARDIAERKRRTAETERMREFLGHMRIAYFRSDQSGKTLHPNDLDCEITGYSRERLATTSRAELLYAEPAEREQLISDLRKAGGRLHKRFVRLRRDKPGDVFYVEADLRIVHDELGAEAGLEGFYHEVTDRVLMQALLDADIGRLLSDGELFQKLKDSAAFQQDYLLSLGHQLNAPFVALIHTLRNVERNVVRGNVAADRMAYALGQTRVCIDMVQNLSFLGRILNAEPLVFQDVPLARLVIRVKLDVKHLLSQRHLSVVIDDDSLDQIGPLQGDPDVLRQVFVNLLDNAIKYSNHDTTIRIAARVASDKAVVDVTNEGLEIPVWLREKIFERGYRTPQAAAIVPHGTGLGLWLVRQMLKLHGASIECRSDPVAPGRGRNRFRITFPR